MPVGIFARLEKRTNTAEACLGTAVTYTITIENITTQPLMDIMFRDAIPQGLGFQQGSVIIGGIPYANANPYQGFPLPDIMPGDMTEVRFTAEATHVPSDNPAINIANIEFRTFTDDGEPISARENSNPVPVIIKDCGCDEDSCEKAICKIYTISLPFTVKPFIRRKTPEIICFGEMTLSEGHVPCPYPPRNFEYTLTQRVRVELPVAFGAEVCYEEPCAEDNGECEAP
ncbi:MAG: DUF11 domain-containing protein [Defluviitaleaceae bacterium]|nr:DUF11 domain-containing protein [Defluviitaleaceae bacterium]